MTKSVSPVVIPNADHSISRDQISANALKVLNGLKAAGYASFLVGGCVRDLMLGREPKDFDVVTDAHPEQVRDLFRNARLIGRRFQLVHVRYGREIIEVATFRAAPEAEDEVSSADLSEQGRILRDNVFGTQAEDALRRDFTVNALYFDAADYSIIDYVNGVEDLKQGVLRVIGDPVQRYREDPVRLLRAVRFAAKLGFRLSPEAEAPIHDIAPLLDDVPPARRFEEALKLFHGGSALKTFEMLRHYRLFGYLFPLTEASLRREQDGFPLALIPRALTSTDDRINTGKPVTPAFLFAVMLWHAMQHKAEQMVANGMSWYEANQFASQWVIQQQSLATSVPRRFSTPAREIWAMQSRLTRRAGKRAFRLLDHPRFRAAYDFLVLRAELGEADVELANWWTEFQEVDDSTKRAMVNEVSGGKSRKPKRGRRRSND